jgi:hypothetical protein
MAQQPMMVYPISQQAITQLQVTPTDLNKAVADIHRYAPTANIDPNKATYVALGPQTGIAEYMVTMTITGSEAGSFVAFTFDTQFTLQTTLIMLGLPTAAGVRGIAMENGVVKADKLTSNSGAVAIAESTNPITCFWDCLRSLGVPSWLLSVAGAVCAVVCVVSDLLACPPCVFGVLAGYAAEVSFCAGACGF